MNTPEKGKEGRSESRVKECKGLFHISFSVDVGLAQLSRSPLLYNAALTADFFFFLCTHCT